jgi:sugar lactone lactonase YvrE
MGTALGRGLEDVQVEVVTDAVAQLGEGPVWDARESVLWWLDIPGEALHRYDPATGEDTAVDLGRQVGSLVPRAEGGLVLATPEGFVAYDPATRAETLLAAVEGDNDATRMNDGKCDRQGRFWAGTMAYEFTTGAGSFYKFDVDGTVTKTVEGVTISNGLAWTADDRNLYYIVTMAGSVDAFDFDAAAGTIANRRPVVKINGTDGLPDGMAIDAEGFLWVALFNGSAVHRYSPEGALDGVLKIPAAKVTCCAFGGDDLGDLYVTTASHELSDDERAAQPHAGKLFRCRPGVTGTPVNAYGG